MHLFNHLSKDDDFIDKAFVSTLVGACTMPRTFNFMLVLVSNRGESSGSTFYWPHLVLWDVNELWAINRYHLNSCMRFSPSMSSDFLFTMFIFLAFDYLLYLGIIWQVRIKKIMQTDEDVGKIAMAVPLLVCK